MEELISKLKDAQAIAQELQARQTPATSSAPHQAQEQAFASHHDDWFECFRATLGSLNRPLVVLSLFDGIGGSWAALERLKIPYIGYSSEIDEHAIRVVKAKFPRVKHLGDVKDISGDDVKEDVDLLIGGFPCQDLTSMGKREGLHASRSKLFFDMLRLMHLFQPRWFLVENVASMTWIDREEITKYLKCHPIEIDSQDLTPNKRSRLYWSNIPHPRKMPRVKEHRSTLLQSILVGATALEQKVSCILTNNHYPGGFGELEPVFDESSKALRYIKVSEVEMCMGFPAGHTDVDFSAVREFGPEQETEDESDPRQRRRRRRRMSEKGKKQVRWELLGNSFSVPVIAYMLSPLLLAPTWDNRVSFPYSHTYMENECSVMEPGEIWALYNSRGHPGWYAIILGRSGGRFDMEGEKDLSIQICFLELDEEYLQAEACRWSPVRGTGLYVRLDEPETQDSFVTLSHKMSTFTKLGDEYFIYPGKDEIWAIMDRHASNPSLYYVFVDDVQIDVDEASLKPGCENFVARYRVMQQAFDSELYRCTNLEVVSKDLAQFSFKVSYHYKSDASLFKLDPAKDRKKSLKFLKTKTRRRRKTSKRKTRDEDEDEDDDSEDDDSD